MKNNFFYYIIFFTALISQRNQANETLRDAISYFGPIKLLETQKEGGDWQFGQVKVDELSKGESLENIKLTVTHNEKTFRISNGLATSNNSSISTLTTSESEKQRVDFLLSPFNYPGLHSDVAFKSKDGEIIASSLIVLPSAAFKKGDIEFIQKHSDGMGSVIENLNNAVSSNNAVVFCGWIGAVQNDGIRGELLTALLSEADGIKVALSLGMCVSEKSKISGKAISQAIERLDAEWTPEERRMIIASLYAQHVFGNALSGNKKPYQALHTFVRIGSKGSKDPLWAVIEKGFKEDLYPVNP